MSTILKRKLNKLDSLLNSSTFSIETLKKYQSLYNRVFKNAKCSGYLSVDVVDATFHRVRIWEEERPWNTIEELWYPPNNLFLPGRLNNPNQRLLYSSENENTALIEKSPPNNSKATILSFKLKNEKLICLELGLSSLKDEQRKFKKQKDRILHNYISKKCKEIVPEDKPHLYIPTITYANGFAPAGFEAFAYDSVPAKFTGTNYAFEPEYIKHNFIFEAARNVKIVNKKARDDFKVICLSQGNKIENGKIIYTDIEGCQSHEISSLMNLE